MKTNARFAERIGKVFLPEADSIQTSDDFTPRPDDPLPPNFPNESFDSRLPFEWPPRAIPTPIWPRFCFTALKQGCYSLSFTPAGRTTVFGTRFRGTLRVELRDNGTRFSGDLYTRRFLDDFLIGSVLQQAPAFGHMFGGDAAADFANDEAADTGGTIPIYPRNKYRSYLKGTAANLVSFRSPGSPCSFTLQMDEFVYNHPATGFSGSFNSTPTRSIRFVLKHTSEADFYTGQAFDGTTLIGSVSIRWISASYRRAALQLHTLQGFEAPPASVGASTMTTIFADVGWDVTFADGGTVPLPAALAAVDPLQCWSNANLHALMASVPGYNPADLDSVWRVHLVAVPARLGCSRGIMFDSSLGADPNSIPREGSATFSRDGYPTSDTSNYDTAANQQQRNVPRAFLRSATHEVGHAFNQIHQQFELGADNSIMTPTPSVADVLGAAGTFPDDINLAFNETVKRHLRHLPDPAVRPGAMDFFGSAVSAPEASDTAWPDSVEMRVDLSSDQVSLGEPVELNFELTNSGELGIPVPEALDMPSLTIRINVTDPSGKITFLRPSTVRSCPNMKLMMLEPGKSVKGSATVYWGRDGFAFETPGRHVVEVIALWDIAGVPVAASGERDIFVRYPISDEDNRVAALLLHPEVGLAVASGRVWMHEGAVKRIREAAKAAKTHPANRMIAKMSTLAAPAPARKNARTAKTPKRRQRTPA